MVGHNVRSLCTETRQRQAKRAGETIFATLAKIYGPTARAFWKMKSTEIA